MPGRLHNKVAVITGSSSGIGRATALAFASEGAHLVCSDLIETFRPELRTDSSDATTVQAARELGAKAIFVRCDTTFSRDVENLIHAAVKEFGRVDIMVNNAGISVEGGSEHGPRPVWEYDEQAFGKTMDVNVKGVFLGLKYATAQMIKQEPHANGDRGWIVNLASVFGLGGGPGVCKFSRSLTHPYSTSLSSTNNENQLTTTKPNSRLRSLQTRSNGSYQSRCMGLRTTSYPRQLHLPRIHSNVFHTRHVYAGRRAEEERSRGAASV